MIIKFTNFILDVDVERTRAFYERSDVRPISEACSCVSCQNFDKAILKASKSALNFLRSLGIDPLKPTEVYNAHGALNKDKTICYNGWYHICGTIVKSPETVNDNGANSKVYLWEHCYSPDPDFPFEVLPVENDTLLHKDFPNPVIQLEISTRLPYVLSIPFEA